MIFFQAIEQDDFEESGAVREVKNETLPTNDLELGHHDLPKYTKERNHWARRSNLNINNSYHPRKIFHQIKSEL
jgi:hypothetical protein